MTPIKTRTDELQRYITTLDAQAEAHVRLQRFNAYATGLRRGFCEGFVICAILAGVAFFVWRWLHA